MAFKSVMEEIAQAEMDRDIRIAEAVKPLLEQAVTEAYTKDAAIMSLAISMKRIADALSYDPSVPENLFDVIRGMRDR